MQNHTECECIHKDRLTAAHSRHVGSSRASHILPLTTTKRSRILHCKKCPLHFEANVEEGICGCICKNGKTECRQRYEGREGFTISDQRFDMWWKLTLLKTYCFFILHRCITQKQCVEPSCLYGTYMSYYGRCPDRSDKIKRGFRRPKWDKISGTPVKLLT